MMFVFDINEFLNDTTQPKVPAKPHGLKGT